MIAVILNGDDDDDDDDDDDGDNAAADGDDDYDDDDDDDDDGDNAAADGDDDYDDDDDEDDDEDDDDEDDDHADAETAAAAAAAANAVVDADANLLPHGSTISVRMSKVVRGLETKYEIQSWYISIVIVCGKSCQPGTVRTRVFICHLLTAKMIMLFDQHRHHVRDIDSRQKLKCVWVKDGVSVCDSLNRLYEYRI